MWFDGMQVIWGWQTNERWYIRPHLLNWILITLLIHYPDTFQIWYLMTLVFIVSTIIMKFSLSFIFSNFKYKCDMCVKILFKTMKKVFVLFVVQNVLDKKNLQQKTSFPTGMALKYFNCCPFVMLGHLRIKRF